MKGIIGKDNTISEISRRLRDSPIFVLLAGCTDVSKVPGITGAGATPDLTFLTPTLDSEIIGDGKSISSEIPPITPDGIPTPAIPSRAMLNLSSAESFVVDAGFSIYPKTSYYHTGLGPARNPEVGRALIEAEKAFGIGQKIGKLLSKGSMVIIAETIPGGTTTAQVVMSTYGGFRSSSSLPDDPTDVKNQIVRRSFARKKLSSKEPLELVAEYGDYTMAISLGICASAETDVLLSGGTQMANIFHLVSLSSAEKLPYLITNRWLMQHRHDTMESLVPPGRLLVSDLNFSNSRHLGLRAYERGIVREGVGISAAFFSALANGSSEEMVYSEIDRFYETFRDL
ncbi:MAG: nicotinate-nucleotide--dimethylbenzimidazole phosphoribosyltransferase [Thermoplasmataceae archaeon]